MGSNSNIRLWYAIILWFITLNLSIFSSFSKPMNKNVTQIHDPTSLDDYLYKYSVKNIKKPYTGILHNISLPSNFSGMEVSIVRLRSSTMWAKGANFSNFDIPTRVITMPFVRRLAILYENLGNFSSQYYELPGYTLISNVLGFAIYNATDLSGKTNPQRINITIAGDPIKVRFSGQLNLPQGKSLKQVKCVRFDKTNDIVVLSELKGPNVCTTYTVGHYALAVPGVDVPHDSQSPSPVSSKVDHHHHHHRVKFALWKRWLIGFAAGLVALMLLVSGTVLCYKTLSSRKISRLERKAEKSEVLDTRWIGTSKMPSASVTRTHGVIENDLAP